MKQLEFQFETPVDQLYEMLRHKIKDCVNGYLFEENNEETRVSITTELNKIIMAGGGGILHEIPVTDEAGNIIGRVTDTKPNTKSAVYETCNVSVSINWEHVFEV